MTALLVVPEIGSATGTATQPATTLLATGTGAIARPRPTTVRLVVAERGSGTASAIHLATIPLVAGMGPTALLAVSGT